MNLRSEILIRRHKQESIRLAETITGEANLFDELMHFFLGDDNEVARHSAWVIGHCYDIKPELFEPYLMPMISNLKSKEVTTAVKRNTVRILQSSTIPTEQMGLLNEICYGYLRSEKEAIAVRVFAMTVLYNIACKFPELKDELIITIEEHMPFGSAGFVSRGNKILKRLKR